MLRWRKTFDHEGAVPLLVTCWPSADEVNVEYQLTDDAVVLENVVITIPIPYVLRLASWFAVTLLL